MRKEEMKARFIRSDGPFLEAVVDLNGKHFVVMDEFGGEKYLQGQEINIRLAAGLFFKKKTWESIFQGNPDGRKDLEHQTGWRYRAYGTISQVGPEVMVDVGIIEIECPIRTQDCRVIGENVAFTIERLEGHAI
jgi:hypothetical protein